MSASQLSILWLVPVSSSRRSLNLKKLSVDDMLGYSHTFWAITY